MTIRMIRVPQLTTAGADGSAVGTATTLGVHHGRLLGVHLDYSGSQAATTDVTVAIAAIDLPAVTFITVSNSATDGWYYPRVLVHDQTGGTATYDGTNVVREPVPFEGYIQVSAAQGNNGETVDVSLLIEE